MNIQAFLNEQVFNYLPVVKEFRREVSKRSGREASQINFIVQRMANQSNKPLNEMGEKELKQFQDEVLARLEYGNYIIR